MMHRWLFEQPWPMRDGAPFRIICAVVEPRNPRMGNGPGAHCARFQRYPQIAANQPVVAQKRRRLTYRDDFGVRGGVMAFERPVSSSSNDNAILDHQRADRHLASRGGRTRERKCVFHHFAGFGQRHLASLAAIGAFGYTAG